MTATAVGYVVLTLTFERDGNRWVGTCEELSTSTYAKTLKQCQRELRDLVIEHLNLLEEAGEREKFFDRWKIEIHPTSSPHEITFRLSGPHSPRFLQESSGAGKPPFLRPSVFRIPLDRLQVAREPSGA